MGKRIVWGVACGAGIAVLLSALVAISLLLGGDARLRATGVTYSQVLLIYLITGAVGGALVALGGKWISKRWVAATVGALTATVLAVSYNALSAEGGTSTRVNLAVTVIYALVVGAPGGLILNEVFVGRNDRQPSGHTRAAKRRNESH
jgi:hypothetical protein